MEQLDQFSTLLELIERPAFCVFDGKIILTNTAAQKRQLLPGTDLADLLAQDTPAPQVPADGCVYLMLNIFGSPCGASAISMADKQFYILEAEVTDSQLQVLALASQQLRAPLSGIMSTVDQLLEAPICSPALLTQLSQVQQRLYQLLRLVSNMSDAYRFRVDGSLQAETVNLTSHFYQILENARVLAEKAGYTLHISVPRQAIFCLADRQMLERSVYNLIANAIKYSPAGSTITAALSQVRDTVYFSLHSPGESPVTDLNRDIFSRYTRQPGIEDGRYGLGLGMTLIRTAALAHGGTLLLEHPQDGGCKVTMALPIRQSSNTTVRTHLLTVDYAGERPHGLVELSEILPPEVFTK